MMMAPAMKTNFVDLKQMNLFIVPRTIRFWTVGHTNVFNEIVAIP